MAMQAEVKGPAPGGARSDAATRHAGDPALLAAALVAALEEALLVARRLLGELDTGAERHAAAAAHPTQVLALAEADSAPQQRVLVLAALAGPCSTAAEPAAGAPPTGLCPGSTSLDAVPTPGRAERAVARDATGGCTPPACPHRLTHREVEVLRLIAAGHSNREIAAALFVSPRTAERHVANIYLKLGAHSKAEAAAYALRHGLA